MRFGEISDPAPQTHPGILFFTNSKKYENTLGFLKIWGGLEQNGQNHAFLNSGDISYPFNGINYPKEVHFRIGFRAQKTYFLFKNKDCKLWNII